MDELCEFLRNPGFTIQSRLRDEQTVRHPIDESRVAIQIRENETERPA